MRIVRSDNFTRERNQLKRSVVNLYYIDANEKNTEIDIAERESFLELAVNDGKFVMTVDYVKDSAKQSEVYQRSTNNGFIPYFTTRDLDTLTIPDFLKETGSKTANFLGITELIVLIILGAIIRSTKIRKKKI